MYLAILALAVLADIADQAFLVLAVIVALAFQAFLDIQALMALVVLVAGLALAVTLELADIQDQG